MPTLLRIVMAALVLQWQCSVVVAETKLKISTGLHFKKKFASDCLE